MRWIRSGSRTTVCRWRRCRGLLRSTSWRRRSRPDCVARCCLASTVRCFRWRWRCRCVARASVCGSCRRRSPRTTRRRCTEGTRLRRRRRRPLQQASSLPRPELAAARRHAQTSSPSRRDSDVTVSASGNHTSSRRSDHGGLLYRAGVIAVDGASYAQRQTSETRLNGEQVRRGHPRCRWQHNRRQRRNDDRKGACCDCRRIQVVRGTTPTAPYSANRLAIITDWQAMRAS